MTCTGKDGRCNNTLARGIGSCGSYLCNTCISDASLVLNPEFVDRVPTERTVRVVLLAKFCYLRALWGKHLKERSEVISQVLSILWDVMDKAGPRAWIMSLDPDRPTKETMRALPDYHEIERTWLRFLPVKFLAKGGRLYYKRRCQLVPPGMFCEDCCVERWRCDCSY